MGSRRITWESVRNIGVVVAICAGFAAILPVYRWLFPDSPRFATQVQSEPVAVPGPLRAEILKWVDLLPSDTPVNLPRFDSLRRHITLSMTNTGNRPAKSVELQIGHNGIAEITESAGSRKQQDFRDRLAIGDVAVRESIDIELWDDAKLSFWDIPTIEICHDDGFQTVELPRQYSGAIEAAIVRAGPWVAISFLVILILVPGLLLAALIVLMRRVLDQRGNQVVNQ